MNQDPASLSPRQTTVKPEIMVSFATPDDYSPLVAMLGENVFDMLMVGAADAELVQVVHDRTLWYALIAWKAAGQPNPDRDHHIGWHNSMRAERIALIAHMHKFFARPVCYDSPDFGRIALRHAIKALPAQWEMLRGFKPLMAEVGLPVRSHDVHTFQSNGWTKLTSKDPDRHVTHWITELTPDARTILRRKRLKASEIGYEVSEFNLLPIPDKLLPSLKATLDTVQDPRTSNKQYSIGSILSLFFMALVCGCSNLKQITEFGARLSYEQTVLLDLPYRKKMKMRMEPGYYVYYCLLRHIRMGEVVRLLHTWLLENVMELPGVLAPDDPLILETLQAMLLGYGHSMRLMEKDQLALNQLVSQRRKPDAILK